MENAKKIYIIISIICVLSIVLGAYAQFFGKKNSKTSGIPTNNTTDGNIVNNPIQPEKEKTMEELKTEFIKNIDNSFNIEEKDILKIEKINNEKGIVYVAYSLQQENEYYDIDLNIPIINIKGDIPKEFNKVTQEVFVKKANEVRKNKNNAEKIIYSIDYVGYLNDNILSIIIKSSLKQGNNPQRIIIQTYNYNIETKEKVSLNNIIEQKNINVQELQNKINDVLKSVKKEETILINSGYPVYERNLESEIYKTENITNFFLNEEGKLYIVFAYGNQNFTSEFDIVKYE